MPLFDRLVDTAPDSPANSPTPVRMQQRTALFASMARDIGRLLNTRRGSGATLYPLTATVLDYGVPSFSHLSAASGPYIVMTGSKDSATAMNINVGDPVSSSAK